MIASLFHLFYVTVLQFVQYKAGRISLISLDFMEVSPFLIHFEPLREALMRLPTFFFILLLQLYNVEMTFQNNFDTVDYNLLDSFDFFPIIS